MESQEPVYNQPVHLINLEVQDNHEDATIGAFLICDMITMVKYIIEKYLNSKSTLSERNTETGHANSRKNILFFDYSSNGATKDFQKYDSFSRRKRENSLS